MNSEAGAIWHSWCSVRSSFWSSNLSGSTCRLSGEALEHKTRISMSGSHYTSLPNTDKVQNSNIKFEDLPGRGRVIRESCTEDRGFCQTGSWPEFSDRAHRKRGCRVGTCMACSKRLNKPHRCSLLSGHRHCPSGSRPDSEIYTDDVYKDLGLAR